jgi:hypothetical protein
MSAITHNRHLSLTSRDRLKQASTPTLFQPASNLHCTHRQMIELAKDDTPPETQKYFV